MVEEKVVVSKSRYIDMQNTINSLQSNVKNLEFELKCKQTVIDAIILPLRNSGLID